MKKIFLLAALALTMAACSNEDNITEQPADIASPEAGIPFTATITTGGATRALSGPDGENKIQAAWATGEHVALVYEVGGTTIVTDAEVTKQTDNSATITATLDGNVTNGTNVTLIYPYSMVEIFGTNIGKLKDNAFTGQNGALTGDGSISKNYDLRQGKGKITLATTPATLKENVAMDSQICIWKLTTKKDLGSGSSEDLSVTKFSAFANGYSAQATFTSTANVFYLAVPAGTSGLTFLATGADASTTYIYNKASVTLAPSTYYESTVTLKQQNTRTIKSTDEEVTLNDGDIVSGTGGENTVLKIAAGATVTLNGLTNNSITKSADVAGIECNGDATIILADGSTNTLKGHWWHPAVFIHSDKTLTIRGGGTLVADNTGGPVGTGIGGGYNDNGGNIVIESGNITAKGGGGAGIGACNNGKSCGAITILGGTITATGINNAAGIGGGQYGSCGDITISGGTVNATGGGYAAGIGGGQDGSCSDIKIIGGTVNATGGSDGAGIGSGKAGDYPASCGAITISGGTVTATGSDEAAGIGSGKADNSSASCGAITIDGSASVEATGGTDAVGIGSGKARNATNDCGDITIGGSARVKALCASKGGCTGIGSGRADNAANSCGAITIGGSASVEASGGNYAAGIGSGYAYYAMNICGNITISGTASVTATGGAYAAGIGSGNAGKYAASCGNITIGSSASVTATGGAYAAGIGSGSGISNGNNIIVSSCEDIRIEGGTVTATGDANAAGIGSGSIGKFARINITSGITSVTATRSNNDNNVPIGKGYKDQGSGAVTFGGVTMHDGTGDASQSNWTNWPTDGQTYGGIKVSANDGDITWTLTPAP